MPATAGVQVFVALADNTVAGGIAVVPSSHKSVLAAPAQQKIEEMQAAVEVDLKSGDILMAASTLLLSSRGCPHMLFRMEFISAGSLPSAGIAPPAQPEHAPAWMAELTPEQRAVVGARTVGLDSKVIFRDAADPPNQL
eukprot:SAG31_NODE_4016_length_3662_cov_3.395453_5_plen_139_part_00